jgi:MerR family transcriptional regulator, redox-sensitive transcriptional activator SoxR
VQVINANATRHLAEHLAISHLHDCSVQFKVHFKSRGKIIMNELTIGEVARYAGIETSAIRFYESVGLLPPPRRINGRNRRYEASVLKRLGLIQLLRDAGFGIRELQVLFSHMNTEAPTTMHWQSLAAQKIAEMEALIKRTEATKIWLTEALKRECRGIDDCIIVTLDETGDGMNVTLSCQVSSSKKASNTQKPITLLTMQPSS